MSNLPKRLARELDASRQAGTYKVLRTLTAPLGPVTTIDGTGEVLVFCSNDYLGLANHPEVVEAGRQGLSRYGAGTASVRFICGTLACHRELEERLADFFGTEAALTFTSCWNANEGLLPTIVERGDALVSDEMNHASIIDAGRLSRATRAIYAHADAEDLERHLQKVAAAPVKVVVSDGVFSMEGDVAPLPALLERCSQHDALLVVDDSHGTGVLGATGRGSAEHFGLDWGGSAGGLVLTSTLGKALGGGNGGFVAGSRDLIEYLVQRSRPHLFSNALAPATACSALRALEVVDREPERVGRLHDNVRTMRDGLRALGYAVVDSPTGIIPIIVGDTARAIQLSEQLLLRGVFVVGFGFPVVPEGHARLRVQMSSEHDDAQIQRALEAFEQLREGD